MYYCKVRNINGSSDNKPPEGYSSWIDAWSSLIGCDNVNCACRDCEKRATDGAHVKKEGTGDNCWYIVPLCHKHNMDNGIIEVVENMLIPANKTEFENLI